MNNYPPGMGNSGPESGYDWDMIWEKKYLPKVDLKREEISDLLADAMINEVTDLIPDHWDQKLTNFIKQTVDEEQDVSILVPLAVEFELVSSWEDFQVEYADEMESDY